MAILGTTAKQRLLRVKAQASIGENPNANRRRLQEYRRRQAAFEKAIRSGQTISFPLPIFEV